MLSQRLDLALESGAIELPDTGQIAVVGASGGTDLSGLPNDRVEIIARHFPDHTAFQGQGFNVAPKLNGPYVLAIVALPRAKAEARLTLASVAKVTSGPIVIDGQKTDGVDSMLKAARAMGVLGEVISKAHGKLFVLRNADFSGWVADGPIQIDGRFETRPGVFSADGIDPGSFALAEALPQKLKGRVIDLGAGWGYLSEAILARDGVSEVALVEADHVALEAAKRNIKDPRASFHWADARTFRPGMLVDHVVSNPPFHQGRRAEPELGQAFIRAAAAMLAPKGALWLVANRHLPYEKTLEDVFRTVTVLVQTQGFKVFHAASPHRRPKG